MTKDELIAQQQLEIEHLKLRLYWALEDKRLIAMILLRDGRFLRYTVEQRRTLYEILDLAETGDHEDIGN